MSLSCESCVLSGRGLSEGPIPHPEESYRVLCVSVCGCVLQYDSVQNKKSLSPTSSS